MFKTGFDIALLVLGILSSLITIIGWFPQAIKTLKTKDTSGISLSFYALIYLSSILWVIYSILVIVNPNLSLENSLPSGLPVLITNIFAIILNTIICIIKIINMINSKKNNMTELEYIIKKQESKS